MREDGKCKVASALTLGAGGGLVADGDGRARLPAPHVASISDTSGAGDAFNGAYFPHGHRANLFPLRINRDEIDVISTHNSIMM